MIPVQLHVTLFLLQVHFPGWLILGLFSKHFQHLTFFKMGSVGMLDKLTTTLAGGKALNNHQPTGICKDLAKVRKES